MSKVVDFESRRRPGVDIRKDQKAADLRSKLQTAREDAAGKTSTRKLLDLYKPKQPKKP